MPIQLSHCFEFLFRKYLSGDGLAMAGKERELICTNSDVVNKQCVNIIIWYRYSINYFVQDSTYYEAMYGGYGDSLVIR